MNREFGKMTCWRVEIELIFIAARDPVRRATVMERRNLSPTRVPWPENKPVICQSGDL